MFKFPDWAKNTIEVIKKKKLYFLVPLAGLTISNYYKDVKLNKQQNIIDVQVGVITNMITKQISSAGTLENIDTAIWFKELDGSLFKVIYLNPAYERFLPKEISRFDLFGRTGYFLDYEFGRIWQKNDRLASQSKTPIVVHEPYRDRDDGELYVGKFLKGRVWSITDKIVLYGIFIERVK